MQYLTKKLILILGLTGLSFITQASIANARDYPMVCRSGGNMKLILTPSSNGTTIEIRFRKARRAYNYNRTNLARGECAWIERPLNQNEPTLMRSHFNNTFIWSEFNVQGNTLPRLGVSGANQRTVNTFLDTVRGRTDQYFTANVHNTNSGYFEISAIQDGG